MQPLNFSKASGQSYLNDKRCQAPLFFYISCCRKPPIHNNNQRIVFLFVFMVWLMLAFAGWLCKPTSKAKAIFEATLPLSSYLPSPYKKRKSTSAHIMLLLRENTKKQPTPQQQQLTQQGHFAPNLNQSKTPLWTSDR